MPALRDLLEVYGAFDQAVIESDNPVTRATIDEFLPGASANPGWYRQLETFFFPGHAGRAPSLGTALDRIAETHDRGESLTTPQKSRLFYAISAIARLQAVTEGTAFGESINFRDDEPLVRALTALAPDRSRSAGGESETFESAKVFLDEVARTFRSYRDFPRVRALAVRSGVLPRDVLDVPPCHTSIVTVNGIQAVLIDTACQSEDVSMNNLKAVVNPFNWDENYPDFFCRMQACTRRPARTDGWHRVLETVGFCRYGGHQLKTDLKFHLFADKSNPAAARLDYDLDDPVFGEGDGQVTVDRGFINMWAWNHDNDPAQPGVRVRTRKVVHINNVLPYAQKMLVCITGYALASEEFLFGRAKNPHGAKPFDYHEDGASTGQTKPAPEPGVPADHVGTTAVKIWADTVTDVSNSCVNLAGKWMAGQLTLDDLESHSRDVGGRLISAPWKFLELVTQPRHPGNQSSDAHRGGGA
jgi:hypothetical protein